MLNDILKRIDQRLEALKISDAAASKMAVGHNEAIRNIRRNIKEGKEKAGVSSTTLQALAPVLETTAGWLIDGTGPEQMPTDELRKILIEVENADLPDELVQRIVRFARFEITNYASRDTAA